MMQESHIVRLLRTLRLAVFLPRNLHITKTLAAMRFLHHESHVEWMICLHSELHQLGLVASAVPSQWRLLLDLQRRIISLLELLWHRLLDLVDQQHREETLHREVEVALTETLLLVVEVHLERQCVVEEVVVQDLDLGAEVVIQDSVVVVGISDSTVVGERQDSVEDLVKIALAEAVVTLDQDTIVEAESMASHEVNRLASSSKAHHPNNLEHLPLAQEDPSPLPRHLDLLVKTAVLLLQLSHAPLLWMHQRVLERLDIPHWSLQQCRTSLKYTLPLQIYRRL